MTSDPNTDPNDFEKHFAAELKKPLTGKADAKAARVPPEPAPVPPVSNLPARQVDFNALMADLQAEVQALVQEAYKTIEAHQSVRNLGESEFALIEARDKLSEAITKAGEFWRTRERMRDQLLNRRRP